MKKHCVFFFIFLFVTINIQSQEVMKLILSENFGYDYFNKTPRNEQASLYERSKTRFYEALKYYDKNQYRAAMSELERALQLCPQGVYYYHYGVCLMDTKDYKNAERVFIKALRYLDFWNPYYDSFDGGINPITAFDQNGIPSEKYFSYYYIACIQSIWNNVNTSFNYLKKAMEYGYPYVDYIFTDSDLKNMLNNYKNVVNQIRVIYDTGFVNAYAGKSFEYGPANETHEYVFIDGKDIFVRSTKDFDNIRYGTYEVKNYHIIIHYNNSDRQEIINIKDISRPIS